VFFFHSASDVRVINIKTGEIVTRQMRVMHAKAVIFLLNPMFSSFSDIIKQSWPGESPIRGKMESNAPAQGHYHFSFTFCASALVFTSSNTHCGFERMEK
jgi:hypothetical protein